jgi:hypothetical protein
MADVAGSAAEADAEQGVLRLRVPVHFCAQPAQFWPEVLAGPAGAATVTDEVLAQRCVGAINNWVMQPAVLFARHRLPFTAGPGLRPDAVNIVSGMDFGLRQRDVNSFLLAMRADGPLPASANFSGEQNTQGLPRPGAGLFPHLPQPGLIPRDPARGTRLETVSFKGGLGNLQEDFRSDAFREALAARGIALRLDLRLTGGDARLTMHDYADVDAVLAVRNLTLADYRTKPASKLVNAWLAGVPAILGPEPAFRELRQDPLDYLEVRDAAEALAALDRLRADPGLYAAMVARAQARAPAHTQQATLAAWLAMIDGPVRESFLRWQARPRLLRLARWPAAALAQKRAFRRALRDRMRGPRGPGLV